VYYAGIEQEQLPSELPSLGDRYEVAQPAPKRPASFRFLRAYFLVANCTVYAFLDPKLQPLQRLRDAWFAYYFVKGWEVVARSRETMKHDFLTSNQRDCIYLNAHSLLLYIWWLASDAVVREHVPFTPHLLGEQQCESLVRLLRAMIGDTNFTLVEELRRISLSARSAAISARRMDDFCDPLHRKHPVYELLHRPVEYLPAIVTRESISAAIAQARQDAVQELAAVGITVSQPSELTPAAAPLANEEDEADDADNADSAAEDDEEDVRIAHEQLRGDEEDDDDDDDDNNGGDGLVHDSAAGSVAADAVGENDAAAAAAAAAGIPDSAVAERIEIQPMGLAPLDLYSERSDELVPRKNASTLLDASGTPLNKKTACAYVSNHNKLSSDRRLKFRGDKTSQSKQKSNTTSE
jgi:DNA-binding transcriptional LysR family regulator